MHCIANYVIKRFPIVGWGGVGGGGVDALAERHAMCAARDSLSLFPNGESISPALQIGLY